MSNDILRDHKVTWDKKIILKRLYSLWYREMLLHFNSGGLCLEVGGGTGNFKEFYPQTVCTDIVQLPWLDVVASAEALPFADGTFANMVLFDVLHHLENPSHFFTESLRVLTDRGRLIIMEPYISPVSWGVYTFFHPEPVIMNVDPLDIVPHHSDRKPFDANQAVAKILFYRNSCRFLDKFPQFSILNKRRMAFFAYPLSGGFDGPCLLPQKLIGFVLTLERLLQPLAPLLAFRTLIVLEKKI